MTYEPQVFNALSGVTGGVWRDGAVVVKALRQSAPDAAPFWQPSSDPRSWRFWRREAHVYETDLPARLGIRAPALLDSIPTDEGVELRLEALDGRTGAALELDDLAETAVILGRSQGRADQPDEGWLSRRFLREYATGREIDFDLLEGEAWPSDVDESTRASLRRLHANSDRLHAIAAALPRTWCHLDVFPNNLIATASGVALIDWAFTGDGAVGEDIGNLVPDAVLDGQFSAEQLPHLEGLVVDAYLTGLREAGWRGDDRLVLLGIHAAAVKYDWLTPRTLATSTSVYANTSEPEQLHAARWAGLALIGRWADEAMGQADALRIL